MKIFDTLGSAAAQVTVIDVRAGLLSSTLQALSDIGFLESAKKGQIAFAVFHILGPSIASLDEIADTARFVGDANYFLVKNFINDTTFFEWDPQDLQFLFQADQGRLRDHRPQAQRNGLRAGGSGERAVRHVRRQQEPRGEPANYSFVLRGYVRHWLGPRLERIRPRQADRPGRAEAGARPRADRRLRHAAGGGGGQCRSPTRSPSSPRRARASARTLLARLLVDFHGHEGREVKTCPLKTKSTLLWVRTSLFQRSSPSLTVVSGPVATTG